MNDRIEPGWLPKDWDGPVSPSVGRGARLERYVEPYHSPHSPGFRQDMPPEDSHEKGQRRPRERP